MQQHELLERARIAGTLSFCALALISSGAWQSPRPIVVLDVPDSVFREVLAPSAQTSGVVVAGLVQASLATELPSYGPTISVAGIPANSRVVCVQLRSSNALYRAEFTMRHQGSAAIVAFRMPTRALSRVSPRGDRVAVVARASRSTGCTEGPLLPVAWGIRTPVDSLLVGVNANGAVDVRVRPNRGASSGCRAVKDSEPSTLYNTICAVSLVELCNERPRIDLLSSDTDRPRQPVRLPLAKFCL